MKIHTSMLISSHPKNHLFFLDLKDVVSWHTSFENYKKSLKGKEKNKCAILELWFF